MSGNSVQVKLYNHRFVFSVSEKGNIEYTVGFDDKKYIAKELNDQGEVILKETVELFFENDVEFVDRVRLSDVDYATLKGEQNLILDKIRKSNDRVKDWSLEKKSKSELLHMVDKWQKKQKTTRAKKKEDRIKYTSHIFMIGRERFAMTERLYQGELLVNPEYKVLTKFNKVGGVAVEEGDMVFWKYYFEGQEQSDVNPEAKKGNWDIARRLTYNEQICYEIIKRYGTYAEKG